MAFPTVAAEPSPPAKQARRRSFSWARRLAAGAGHRDDIHDGVGPGRVAILPGGNFAKNRSAVAGARPLRRLPVRLLTVSPDRGGLFASGVDSSPTHPVARPPAATRWRA
jgi:hypothetical protein